MICMNHNAPKASEKSRTYIPGDVEVASLALRKRFAQYSPLVQVVKVVLRVLCFNLYGW